VIRATILQKRKCRGFPKDTWKTMIASVKEGEVATEGGLKESES